MSRRWQGAPHYRDQSLDPEEWATEGEQPPEASQDEYPVPEVLPGVTHPYYTGWNPHSHFPSQPIPYASFPALVPFAQPPVPAPTTVAGQLAYLQSSTYVGQPFPPLYTLGHPSHGTGPASLTPMPVPRPTPSHPLREGQGPFGDPGLPAGRFHPPVIPPSLLPFVREPILPPALAIPAHPAAPTGSNAPAADEGAPRGRRTRRPGSEIPRHFHCSWPGCDKAYELLGYLNNHIVAKGHGPKRLRAEFPEVPVEATRRAQPGRGDRGGGRAGGRGSRGPRGSRGSSQAGSMGGC